jgi:hypothetical protein
VLGVLGTGSSEGVLKGWKGGVSIIEGLKGVWRLGHTSSSVSLSFSSANEPDDDV